MKKILFVNLLDLDNMYVRTKQLGQLSLYNIINHSNKWRAEVWDANYLYLHKKLKLYSSAIHNYNIMADDIVDKNPTCISIYTMCNNYYQALSMAKIIKTANKSIKIILAGPQASTAAYETLEKFEFVDYIALGEGENTILNILDFVESNLNEQTDICDVKGLAYRKKDGKIVEAWNRNDWFDLDKLEPLKYEIVDEYVFDGNTVIDMEIGRGCPFSCTYCSTSMFWERNFRVKSVEKVINEVIFYKNKYAISTFAFHHDLLTANKKYIMQLTRKLIDSKLNIKWACYSRLDVIDSEMIKAMGEAGCNQIYYGIETGSPRMQKIINKNLDLRRIYIIMDNMFENKIKAEFSFIIGYPEETSEDLDKTVEFIKSIKEYEINKDQLFIQIHIFQIMFFPKTKMTTECLNDLKYDPYILENSSSDIPYGLLPEELEWIKNNKEIFVNYYNLEKNISEKAKNMNVFLMMIFNYGYNFCIKTLKEALNRVNGDILQLYDFVYLNKRAELLDTLSYVYFNHRNTHEGICKKVNALLNF